MIRGREGFVRERNVTREREGGKGWREREIMQRWR